jgi:tetratricopeptide (TPR) repeat protein
MTRQPNPNVVGPLPLREGGTGVRSAFAMGCVFASSIAFAAPAFALSDEEIRARVEHVEDLLEAWQNSDARVEVEALANEAPDNPHVKYAIARVRFEEGDYAGAVALFDETGAQKTFAALARDTLAQTKDYESRESAHFVIRYHPGKDAALAPYALDTLEKIREALGEDLGHTPPGKVRVEVLQDAKALSVVSTLTLEQIKTSGTIAICKFNKLMITSPKALLRGYTWQDTLAHEYTHLVISEKSRNTVPIWIHEGLAKFFESAWRGPPGQALSPTSAAMLAVALKKNKLIPFEKMHPSMALLPSQDDAALAFAEVFTAIEFMYKKGGMKALNDLIAALKSGEEDEEAVATAMGEPFSRFTQDWKAALRRRPFPKEAMPADAEHLAFADDDPRVKAKEKQKDKDDEMRFGDFLDVSDPKARQLAHLGELLRARERPRAAAEEFSRAYEREGDRSPSLSNRYAQALISSKSLDRAREVLAASLKPYPHYPSTYLNLGRVDRLAGNDASAESDFLNVVSIDPFDPEPHVALHDIYAKRHDDKRTEREKQVLEILVGRRSSLGNGDGSVRFTSHPYSRVFVDGRDTGLTTPAIVPVPAGRHLVKFVNDERGISEQETFDVGPGEDVEVTMDLSRPPPGAGEAQSTAKGTSP